MAITENWHQDHEDVLAKIFLVIWGNYFLQVNFLGTIGGENVKDCVRRTMKSLITTDMAVKFNWKGKGEKMPFSSLQLSGVVKSKFIDIYIWPYPQSVTQHYIYHVHICFKRLHVFRPLTLKTCLGKCLDSKCILTAHAHLHMFRYKIRCFFYKALRIKIQEFVYIFFFAPHRYSVSHHRQRNMPLHRND